MATSLADLWKVGSTAPIPDDLEIGGLGIDIVGMIAYSKNNVGDIFPIGGGVGDTVTSVNGEVGDVVLDNTDVGAAATVHTHAIADTTNLQTELDDRPRLDAHVASSSGAQEAGKPIVLNGSGKLDPSFSDTSIVHYAGDFTPAGGVIATEYPDVVADLETAGATYVVTGLGTDVSYTFIEGSLATKVVDDGDFMVWNGDATLGDGWAVISGEMNPADYYKLDGSVAITHPFAGGTQLISNIADGVAVTDAATKGQLDVVDGKADSNATAIGTNTTNIATNTGDIATNTGDITTVEGRVLVNEGDIITLDGEMTAVEGRVTAIEADYTTSVDIDTVIMKLGTY